MGLFRPVWMCDGKHDRVISAVSRIKSQKKLKRIALNTRACSDAKIAAYHCMMDEDILMSVALKEEPHLSRVRDAFEKAVDRLTDPAKMYTLVMHAKSYSVRSRVLDRINEPEMLAQIAQQCDDNSLRMDVTERIEDKALLAHIAHSDPYWRVCAAAYKKLGMASEANTLMALNAQPSDRRRAIQSGTIDQKILLEICQSDENKSVRRAAFDQLTDPADMTYLAVEAVDPAIRESAVQHMPEDQDVFMGAVMRDQSNAALMRLAPSGLVRVFIRGGRMSVNAAEILLKKSKDGQHEWTEFVSKDDLDKLIEICFENKSESASKLLKQIYKSGRFIESIGRLQGRVFREASHDDHHPSHSDLGDHLDWGHTDSMLDPVLFNLD